MAATTFETNTNIADNKPLTSEMEKRDEETGNNITPIRNLQERNTKKSRKKILVILTIFFIILVTCGIPLILYGLKHNKTNKMSKLNSINIVENINENNEDSNNLINEAFNGLDDNNDGKLDYQEFNDFSKKEIENGELFERIDIDKNEVLSFGEQIAYINITYNKDYKMNEDELESMALTYFSQFDPNNNGFILKEYFIKKTIENEFNLFDNNNDGYITEVEFIDAIYGVNNPKSWINIFKEVFGDNYSNNINNINKPSISDLLNIKINNCNSLFDVDNKNRRRLAAGGCAYVCWNGICFTYCS